MKRNSTGEFRKLPAALLMSLLATMGPSGGNAATSGPADSIVQLKVTQRKYTPNRPYAAPTMTEVHAVGVLVAPRLIVTDLETIRDAAGIEARGASDAVFQKAIVQYRGYDSGLALLTVKDATFFSRLKVLPLDLTTPALGSALNVYGFIKKRAVLRRMLVNSAGRELLDGSDVDKHRLLFLSSRAPDTFVGGPAVRGNRMLGLLHGGKRNYVISAGVIRHFLDDVADGKYNGFPNGGFLYSRLENPAQRERLKLDEKAGGVLIRRVAYRSAAWQKLTPGDVLLSFDNRPVSAAGRLTVGESRIALNEYIQSRQTGPAILKIRRGTKNQTVILNLDSYSGYAWMRRRSHTERPYFLSGGLVFQELDYELIHGSAAGNLRLLRYRYHSFHEDLLSQQADRDVVLTGVLEDPINDGAGLLVNGIVDYINDRRIRNLRDFAREWNAAQGKYMVLRFHNRPMPIIIPTAALKEANERIYRKYGVRELENVR